MWLYYIEGIFEQKKIFHVSVTKSIVLFLIRHYGDKYFVLLFVLLTFTYTLLYFIYIHIYFKSYSHLTRHIKYSFLFCYKFIKILLINYYILCLICRKYWSVIFWIYISCCTKILSVFSIPFFKYPLSMTSINHLPPQWPYACLPPEATFFYLVCDSVLFFIKFVKYIWRIIVTSLFLYILISHNSHYSSLKTFLSIKQYSN